MSSYKFTAPIIILLVLNSWNALALVNNLMRDHNSIKTVLLLCSTCHLHPLLQKNFFPPKRWNVALSGIGVREERSKVGRSTRKWNSVRDGNILSHDWVWKVFWIANLIELGCFGYWVVLILILILILEFCFVGTFANEDQLLFGPCESF